MAETEKGTTGNGKNPKPTFTFQSGRTVTLNRLKNRLALKHFKSQAAAWRQLYKSGIEMTPDLISDAEDFSERFFLYLAGWCVDENPEGPDLDELEIFCTSESERVRRAKWVRYVLLTSNEEASDFIAACLLSG